MALLDSCVAITSVITPSCIGPSPMDCGGGLVPILPCSPDVEIPPEIVCVSDIARRPWPSPPPADLGCNPVSVQVTNVPPDPEDPDQSLRLEGDVSYISGDACLPKVNLKLVAPPSIIGGGGSPNQFGVGYTHYQQCVWVGPSNLTQYKTPQSFFGNEPGAAAFYPTNSTAENAEACEACNARSRYGGNVAKFNLIGPILVEITNSTPAAQVPLSYVASNGQAVEEQVVYAWDYEFVPSVCVVSKSQCWTGGCDPSTGYSWTEYENDFEGVMAHNIKENVDYGFAATIAKYGVGVDLIDMLQKGYTPRPIMQGTQVLLYGFVPWGTRKQYNENTQKYESVANEDTCNCAIEWFFSEQNAFRGECRNQQDPAPGELATMLPTRNVTSAGMFFGVDSNANRV
jgi:hypothetical protein